MSDAASAGAIYRRRAELLTELAKLELELARIASAPAEKPDEVLSLEQAASLLNEPPSVVRRKPEYLKTRVSAFGARRARFSRRALERLIADRLAQQGGSQ